MASNLYSACMELCKNSAGHQDYVEAARYCKLAQRVVESYPQMDFVTQHGSPIDHQVCHMTDDLHHVHVLPLCLQMPASSLKGPTHDRASANTLRKS